MAGSVNSKYNAYWEKKLPEISRLIDHAMTRGFSEELDVSDIERFGDRVSWYGKALVDGRGVRTTQMAHAASLAGVVVVTGLVLSYQDFTFEFKISANKKLTVIARRDGHGAG